MTGTQYSHVLMVGVEVDQKLTKTTEKSLATKGRGEGESCRSRGLARPTTVGQPLERPGHARPGQTEASRAV